LVVGVDVGGTKIAAGVVDEQGQVYSRVKQPTYTSSPEVTLQCIAAAVNEAIAAAGIDRVHIGGVGLGIPGKVDPEQGIGVLSVNLGWRDVPVRNWLEDALGLPCAIENDVRAAILGESQYGAGRGVSNLVYLSLGTGIAASILIAGHLWRGAHGLAGEIGHTVFVADGTPCRCGARGCLEALAAGPALALRAQEEIRAGRASLLQRMTANHTDLTAEHIFAAAAQGDDLASQILSEAASHIAYAIYLLAMAYDPQMVVLGGGLAHEGSPLIEAVRSGVVRWMEQALIFREILDEQALCVTSLQRDAGILGAAALIIARHAVAGEAQR
jgi:glucokinase